MPRYQSPPEPTPEQCTNNEWISLEGWEGWDKGWVAFAAWYPQMGGYVGRAVICIGRIPNREDEEDSCFEAFVWHDGEWPFRGEDGDNPIHIHHCMASQFIEFGELVLAKEKERGQKNKEGEGRSSQASEEKGLET